MQQVYGYLIKLFIFKVNEDYLRIIFVNILCNFTAIAISLFRNYSDILNN